MKKMFALIMAIAIVMSFALPVAAADPTYDLTINGHAPNHIYEAYQIFSGKLDSTGNILSDIGWGSGVDYEAFVNFLNDPATTAAEIFEEYRMEGGSLVHYKNVFEGKTNVADIVAVLQRYADKDKMLDIFAKEIAPYLTTPAGTATSTTTTYVIEDLPAGYYLVRDKADSLADPVVDDFYTKFMLEVVGNVSVTVKGNVPVVSKTVSNTENGAYNEHVTNMSNTPLWFELSASLPSNFEIYDEYTMEFVDTMSEGLTFVDGSVKAYILRAGGLEELDPAHYIVSSVTDTTKDSKPATTFTVRFPNIKHDTFPTLLLDNKIVIHYSAKLNEKAVIGIEGNPNYVDLIYSNDPYSDGKGKTGPDEAIVFTFGMNVIKHDKNDPSLKLNGAEFVLYRREVVTDPLGKETLTMQFVVAENGVFKEWITIQNIEIGTSSALTWNNAKAVLTPEQMAKITLTTANIGGTDGKISVAGLDLHTYHILEIKAPDGYNLPADPFKITVEPVYDSTGKFTGMQYEYGSTTMVDANNDGFAEIDIANGKGNTLPSTGGMGTTLFYAIGGIMVMAAVVLMITKKRMNVA